MVRIGDHQRVFEAEGAREKFLELIAKCGDEVRGGDASTVQPEMKTPDPADSGPGAEAASIGRARYSGSTVSPYSR